jgi:hypothetical protein
VPLTAVEAEHLANQEGLTLVRTSQSQTGFKGVSTTRGGRFCAIGTGGVSEYLGTAATAEEAALLYARHLGPEASAAAAAAAAVPLTAVEAEQLAAEEGLMLVRTSQSQTGFKGVVSRRGRFRANFQHGGVNEHLGTADVPEEAALLYARRLGPEASTGRQRQLQYC